MTFGSWYRSVMTKKLSLAHPPKEGWAFTCDGQGSISTFGIWKLSMEFPDSKFVDAENPQRSICIKQIVNTWHLLQTTQLVWTTQQLFCHLPILVVLHRVLLLGMYHTQGFLLGNGTRIFQDPSPVQFEASPQASWRSFESLQWDARRHRRCQQWPTTPEG